jgi:hypothetical protein
MEDYLADALSITDDEPVHFENTAIFQQSSNEAILPLPKHYLLSGNHYRMQNSAFCVEHLYLKKVTGMQIVVGML